MTDSNKLTLTRPTSATTKAAEQEQLTALRDFYAGTQSYLADLFTTGLVEWATRQIAEGGVPNIFEWYEHSMAETVAAQKSMDGLRETLQRDLKEARTDRDEARNGRRILDDLLLKERDEHRNYVTRAVNERTELLDMINNESAAKHEAISLCQQQAAEIVRLKALLWDMSEKLNGGK